MNAGVMPVNQLDDQMDDSDMVLITEYVQACIVCHWYCHLKVKEANSDFAFDTLYGISSF